MNDKNKKTLLENEVKELYKLIFEKENEIIEIDKKLALFSDITILDNMKLSDKQELIVNSDENNILVVACPGSGKTHTLISRYIKLCIKKDDIDNNEKLCKEWINNKNINPETKRKIKDTSPIYKRYIKLCNKIIVK